MTKLLAMPGEGEKLDRFELVAEIAQGGMATVYLARLLGVGGFKRFVAIKRLHAHLAGEQEFIEMFLDEARIAARIHHPNVVPILEIGEHNSQYYLVMEYIEGDTAGRLVARAAGRQQRLPPSITSRIMLDSLTGLHAAHELRDDAGDLQHVVHRDVSPQNILVGVDGVGRITDFGVARAAARLTSTRGGQVKGKLAYLSPEQVRGGEVDRRADIFAAGIVMWELFTSERLFKGEADADTLFRIVAAEVPSMRAIHPQVPPAVEAVCLKALAREPKDRWQTAQDFAEALENAARATNALANIRETSAYVNDIIGQDISAQREIVRAWLARSESRSGVAAMAGVAPHMRPPEGTASRPRQPDPARTAPTHVPAPSPPAVRAPAPAPVAMRAPQMTVPSAAPSAEELTSLEDDDEDVVTRIDQPLAEKEGSSMPPMPMPYLDPPRAQPQIHMGFGNTARIGSELNTTQPTHADPNQFAAAQALPPAPPPMGAQPAMVPTSPKSTRGGGGLPMWTLAIPAVIILGGGAVLALKFLRPPADAPVKAQPSATVSAATTATSKPAIVDPFPTSLPPPIVDTSTAAPSASVPPVVTAMPTADTATAAVPTVTAPTSTPTQTSKPTAVVTATPVPTQKPTSTGGGPKPLPTGRPKKPAVDNSDFGGRR